MKGYRPEPLSRPLPHKPIEPLASAMDSKLAERLHAEREAMKSQQLVRAAEAAVKALRDTGKTPAGGPVWLDRKLVAMDDLPRATLLSPNPSFSVMSVARQ